MKTISIGDVTIDNIWEAGGPYRPPEEVYPDITPEIIDRHRPWMIESCMEEATGFLVFAFQSYLIRTPRHTILVDCCVGEDKERPHRPNWHMKKWPWMANLLAAGVTPEEIDFVMCTHLHVDHVGWNTQLKDGRWVPTFPNARYIFSAAEYEYWKEAIADQDWIRDAFNDSVLPVVEAGRADLVADDHEIDTGLWLAPAPGHTPGAVVLNLESGGDKAIFTGDMMHHALQVPEPQLSTIFCSDPVQSAKTRTEFVQNNADTGNLILPAHFPGESAGRIVSQGDCCMFEFEKP